MDLVWKRTAAKGVPQGYWRWNIRNPYTYARTLARELKRYKEKKMTPSRLKLAIEEDSHQSISVKDSRAIMRKANLL